MGTRTRQSDALPVYRPDIDGLRAVAVLLVLGDHLKTHVSGGFVGVDVFFVISGYLIGSAILREMADGTFTIAGFYERRVRRIFPALIVVLLVTSALAYRFLFPAELVDYAGSLLAAMFSASNFWFWHQAGYFSAPSAFKPLLHTWSLGVEEQFYIFFPILLVLIRKFARKQLKTAIVAIALVTFGLGVWYVRKDAATAFFFSPLRAWELLIGTIVSQRYLPPIRTAMTRNVASAAGLLLIMVPAFIYTESTPFPGLAALPPCLGAALVIAAGETGTSLGGRLLSLRPVVFIGSISYSLYLWHWPLIVFHNIGSVFPQFTADDRRFKLLTVALSIGLATLSWRFVETPFRRGRFRPARRTLILVNGAAVAVVAAIGVAILVSGGIPSRFPADALAAARYLSYAKEKPFRQGSCFIGENARDPFSGFNQSTCLSEASNRDNVLILGDSHAAQLWTGLSQVYPEVHLQQATVAFCWVFLAEPASGSTTACGQMGDFVYYDYLIHRHVDAVIFAGRWTLATIPDIARSLGWMKQHGIPVYLVGPMIEYDQAFPRVLAMSLRDRNAGLVADHRTDAPKALDQTLAALARDQWHVPYISFYDNLCHPGCPVYAAPGVPLLFDQHHLTADGSILFARSIRDRKQLPF